MCAHCNQAQYAIMTDEFMIGAIAGFWGPVNTNIISRSYEIRMKAPTLLAVCLHGMRGYSEKKAFSQEVRPVACSYEAYVGENRACLLLFWFNKIGTAKSLSGKTEKHLFCGDLSTWGRVQWKSTCCSETLKIAHTARKEKRM